MPPNPILEQIRKPQILDAALRIISEQGPNFITLQHVADAAGLSKGGLAHYFPSKELLFKETFKEFFTRIFIRGRETMNEHADPLEKLLSFRWIYDREDPEVNVGYPLLFDGMALAARDPEYRSMLSEWFENWVVMLREALQEGNDQGRFIVKDLDGTARAISAIYQGIGMRWYLAPEAHPTDWATGFLELSITRLMGIS